ncbi:MAG: WYL domain-containing protein [Syntrophales bacterium]|nr:WYL domain-containing protein [Syntrophales bacterium]MDD4996985.1 WYL domain-containing protein [Syntrophales bacterium]
MPPKLIYERFLWFDHEVRNKKFPNAATLAEKFEVTPKTAQRNIEFMKERLRAPLQYVAGRRGYVYEDDAWELPGFWLDEEKLTSLLIAYRLASSIPDSALKTSLEAFLDHVLARLSHTGAVSLAELNEKVSVKNIEYSMTGEPIFHRVLEALLRSEAVAIKYYSPHKNEYTTRDILPLHLLQYMGTWHIIAWCALKNGLRDFVLSRIGAVTPSERVVAARVPGSSVKEYIRRNFGIMNSAEAVEVCLRFSPAVAPWIAEQVWHPAQQVRREADDALCLTFPVADFREVRREILKYGSQVEVVSPKELREEVKKEIKKMKRNYI